MVTKVEERAALKSFAARAVIAILLGALALLIWRVAGVLLLLFAAILLAIFVRTAATALCNAVRAPMWCCLAVVLLSLACVVGGVVFLFGAHIASQFDYLGSSLPKMLGAIQDYLQSKPWGRLILEQLEGSRETGGGLGATYRKTFTSTLGVIADVVLVLAVAIYLAAQPGHYARGLLELVPPGRRARVAELLETLANALSHWIAGKLATMAIVGIVTTGGLVALGVPSAFALGLIAAFAELVPLFGPMLAAVPAILLAATEDFSLAIYVIVLFLAIQQIESYAISPLIQRKAASLPPVLALAAILSFGVLFGPMGVLLAEALAITAMVVVKMLYVEDGLGVPTRVPGRDDIS